MSQGYLLARNAKLPIRKLGRKSGVLQSDLIHYLKSLPLEDRKSERHREQALRRWATHRAESRKTQA